MGVTYLEYHANANVNGYPRRVSHVFQTVKPRRAVAVVYTSIPEFEMGELLLHLGNVKETEVRSMEQGDTQWKVHAHAEVLDIVGENHTHSSTDGISDLAQDPVYMEKHDG